MHLIFLFLGMAMGGHSRVVVSRSVLTSSSSVDTKTSQHSCPTGGTVNLALPTRYWTSTFCRTSRLREFWCLLLHGSSARRWSHLMMIGISITEYIPGSLAILNVLASHPLQISRQAQCMDSPLYFVKE